MMSQYPSKQDVIDYIKDQAIARGIDPDTAVAVAKSEGLNADPADGWQSYVGGSGKNREKSYGPFQLYTGGGLGNEFNKKTGLDVTDWSTWKEQVQFSLDHAAEKGWSAFHGAKNTGISKWEGLDKAKAKGVQQANTGFNNPFTQTFNPTQFMQDNQINVAIGPDGKIRAYAKDNSFASIMAANAANMGAFFQGKLGPPSIVADAKEMQRKADALAISDVKAFNAGVTRGTDGLLDDLPMSMPPTINVNSRMNPLLDLVGAHPSVSKKAEDVLSGVLDGPYQRAAQHYEFLTGKPMPPVNDAIAKEHSGRFNPRSRDYNPNSFHTKGKALDFGTRDLSNFEKLALDESLKVAGFTGHGYGRNIQHADVGTQRSRGWGYGYPTYAGQKTSDMVASARSGASMLPSGIPVPNAPVPTPRAQGITQGVEPVLASSMPPNLSSTLSGNTPSERAADIAKSFVSQNVSSAFSPPAKMGRMTPNPSGSLTRTPDYTQTGMMRGPLNSRMPDFEYTTKTFNAPAPAAKPTYKDVITSAYEEAAYGTPKPAATQVQPHRALNPARIQDERNLSMPARPYPSVDPKVVMQTPIWSIQNTPVTPRQVQTVKPAPLKMDPKSITERAKEKAAKAIGKILDPNFEEERVPGLPSIPGLSIPGLNISLPNFGGSTGSNYTGEWTPAAGGNLVSSGPIGYGIGGEALRGVTNQHGAVSMLGEGGSRTYGGPGGGATK